MAWFKIDDGFHCHPKVLAAGTPAIGLYVRCGSWAAQQVTDGIVPKHVAKMYGTPRMIKALVDAGLWHQKGHDCDSCPELDANSYAIHQYLERNPSRVETELARKAKTERQQRWREGKKKEQVNDSHGPEVDADVDASTRRHGDAAPDPTPPDPTQESPSETLPPPPPSTHSAPDNTIEVSGRGEIQPLIEAMEARGMSVAWSFSAAEWIDLRDAVRRAGVPALVDHAARAWTAAKSAPYSAKYFLRGWTGVQAPTAYTGPRPVTGPDDPALTRRNAARDYLDQLTDQLRAGGDFQ